MSILIGLLLLAASIKCTSVMCDEIKSGSYTAWLFVLICVISTLMDAYIGLINYLNG